MYSGRELKRLELVCRMCSYFSLMSVKNKNETNHPIVQCPYFARQICFQLQIHSCLKIKYRGPRLVQFLGPGKNRTMRNSYQLSSTQTEFHQYEFTNNKFHQYEFYTYSTKIRTFGIRTSGDRTSGGPPVFVYSNWGQVLYIHAHFISDMTSKNKQ